jgi:hypothetical protein
MKVTRIYREETQETNGHEEDGEEDDSQFDDPEGFVDTISDKGLFDSNKMPVPVSLDIKSHVYFTFVL